MLLKVINININIIVIIIIITAAAATTSTESDPCSYEATKAVAKKPRKKYEVVFCIHLYSQCIHTCMIYIIYTSHYYYYYYY